MVLDRNKNKMDDTIHGLVALGAVIQGETPHFDVINQGVTQGIMRLMLDTGTPIGFGILTTHNWFVLSLQKGTAIVQYTFKLSQICT